MTQTIFDFDAAERKPVKPSRLARPFVVYVQGPKQYPAGCLMYSARDEVAVQDLIAGAVRYCEKHDPDAVIELRYVRNIKREDYDVLKTIDLSR